MGVDSVMGLIFFIGITGGAVCFWLGTRQRPNPDIATEKMRNEIFSRLVGLAYQDLAIKEGREDTPSDSTVLERHSQMIGYAGALEIIEHRPWQGILHTAYACVTPVKESIEDCLDELIAISELQLVDFDEEQKILESV